MSRSIISRCLVCVALLGYLLGFSPAMAASETLSDTLKTSLSSLWMMPTRPAALPHPASSPTAAQQPLCHAHLITTVTLQETGYYLTIIATIQHHPLSMILDTGSEGSLLTPDAVTRLHLSPTFGDGVIISGSDGHGHIVPTIQPPALTLGDVTFQHPSLPLGALPSFPAITPPVLGLLGMDLLGHYDVDLDLPHHRMSLWDVKAQSILCPRPPFWPHAALRLPSLRINGRFFIPFTLDGQKGTALIDSGARSHIISTSFVEKLGITQDTLARDPGGASAGIGDREHMYHWHRFHALNLGGQTQRNPVLTVTPLHAQADMLLGADWLTHHHIWLSALSEGAVFLQ